MAAEFAQTPDSPDLLLRRANLKMRLGQFKEALPDIDRVTQKMPDDHWPWYLKACLCLHLGDENGYQDSCREMLKRFSDNESPYELARTAKVCLLSPRALENPEFLRALAGKPRRPCGGTREPRKCFPGCC